MLSFSKTHIGKVRLNNEDSVFKENDKIGCLENIFIVADGMGGHNAGEVASKLSIEYLKEYLTSNNYELDTEEILMDSIFSANQKIYAKAKTDLENKGMGTTLTVCTIKEDKAYFGHVGDSRAYLFREDELIQLTNDHTYVSEMVKKGLMTKEQALVDPNRNMITRAVGIDQTVRVDTFSIEIKEDDLILLCSDGLSGLVSDEVIFEVVSSDDKLDVKCDNLIDKALENGGIDNISVVLINV